MKTNLRLGRDGMPKAQHVTQHMRPGIKSGINSIDYDLHVSADVPHVIGEPYQADTFFGLVDVVFEKALDAGEFRLQLKGVPSAGEFELE